ncbi:MAG: hypothetical protein AMXMBFR85_10570 [Dehalococcoides mccartyi]
MVFIATKNNARFYKSVFSEVCIWNPAEIRLLGAISLSRHLPAFCPWHKFNVSYASSSTDLSSDDAISHCIEEALNFIDNQGVNNFTKYKLSIPDSIEDETTQRYEKKIYNSIKISDNLLLRGIYTLLKARLCVSTPPYAFMEEAFMNLRIAGEAAMECIKQHLSYQGNSNPSMPNVYEYIKQHAAHGDCLTSYLEELHESWIMTKHPSSKFGEFWAPSLSADDVYEQFDIISVLYKHILLSEVIQL